MFSRTPKLIGVVCSQRSTQTAQLGSVALTSFPAFRCNTSRNTHTFTYGYKGISHYPKSYACISRHTHTHTSTPHTTDTLSGQFKQSQIGNLLGLGSSKEMSDTLTPAMQESSPKRVKIDTDAGSNVVSSTVSGGDTASDSVKAADTTTEKDSNTENKDVTPPTESSDGTGVAEDKSGKDKRAERKDKYKNGRDNKNTRGGRGGRDGKTHSQYSNEKHGSRNREAVAAREYERRDHRGENQRKPKELAEGEVAVPRKPKRKVAFLLSYCGTGYYGMQINAGVATIEEELRQAFEKAGVVSPENAVDLKKVRGMFILEDSILSAFAPSHSTEYSQSDEAVWRPLTQPMEEAKDEFDEENEKAMPDVSDVAKTTTDKPAESATETAVGATTTPPIETEMETETETATEAVPATDSENVSAP
ncbi:hypothetical protein SARC_06514 [Sphaeroforma arctica JP610]|uniref:Pseudouridine synthase I TruA alpha/beta domain-containing protein n=1 Tax=Sphaeroforma arctica JP610 TaxID=667725 RepID=A0A0L0FWF8_9EUKA|nr:hypothetical protein SARC_06514 [Sphaeroforma arctica JP610]KNC81147.1 hypothetical protein SARC_06514 [Sphaeroforma arctica JP610]|eukprot:XP_014155049.1 hypothetical protein SARC_06514 [Sphaeroforma arctica JP610]